MVKKIACILFSLLFVISIAACGGNDANSNDSYSKDQTNASNNDYVMSGGIIDVSVDSELIEQSELANKDFGGKDAQFYFWYQTNEIVNRKVSEFNKKHNANVKVVIGTSFAEDLAKSIAGGKPYTMTANSARFFPQTVFSNLYEPLNDLIKEVDYFDSAKPDNGGISKQLNESFTWNGKFYAAGSAQACYSYAYYYNKKKYEEAGLEDPYELWKKGEWTWEKMVEQGKQVTDVSNGVGFLEAPELHTWLSLHGLTYIKKTGENTFSDNLTDKDVVQAINDYKALVISDEPICVMGTKKLSWYSYIATIDAYTQIATNVKTSSNFGRKVANLGVVPIPSGTIAGGKYPTHIPQGYSAVKGSAEPTMAPCYALFESRIADSDVGSDLQMPSEIRNYINNAFSSNGFAPLVGFENTEGRNIIQVINLDVGYPLILNNADVTATLTEKRPVLNAVITSALSNASNFKG